ncbi:hypothetical protein PHMEG_00015234 [Phytophthora megakarya]|uniref:Uncharacterized protein n=1 Tax=Phytophthora megakarya TaxID=4795 RepID=A0A225W3X3_9STRA|nr:hypothetical protein PHMEG_00015234 [Phytophthora megakarya]
MKSTLILANLRNSPKKQLDTQWRTKIEQNHRYFDAKQEQQSIQQNMVLHEQQEPRAHEADYAQYLYLSTLYGPLDALLYCCCRPGSHGRVYMLLVDTSARRIQCWAFKMVATLLRYWVGRSAREKVSNLLSTVLNINVKLHHYFNDRDFFEQLEFFEPGVSIEKPSTLTNCN